ncbi:MAG: hypothetical protein Q8K26_00375, partial [Candidatus Gracilibacteria bacterium]|nr:hypothetical protein [Candidatus Gracilibacteria bacterium]
GKENYIPVASGVVALDELEQTLYRSIRLLNGQITPQEYSVYDFQKGGGLDPASILKKGLGGYLITVKKCAPRC